MSRIPHADALAAVIERTARAFALVDADERASWVFARCWMLASRYEEHGWAPADIDAAIADFETLPGTLPGRAKLAAMMATALLRSGSLVGSERMGRAISLADVADADPAPLRDWPVTSATLRAADLLAAGQEGRPGFNPRTASADVERYALIVGDTEPHTKMIEMARLGLRHLIGQAEANIGEAQEVTQGARAFDDKLDPGSPLRDRSTLLTLLAEVHELGLRGDVLAAVDKLDEIRRVVDRLPLGDPLRLSSEQALASIEPLLDMLRPNRAPSGGDRNDSRTTPRTGNLTPPPDAALRRLEEFAREPDLPGSERALRLANLGTAELGMDTPQSVDSAVQHLHEALAAAADHDPRLAFYLLSAGAARIRRREMTGRADDLVRGIELLEQARALTEPTAQTLWTTIAMPLAHAYRLAGRTESCRLTALSGLRGHTWNVLLQANPDEMQAAARHAADDALDTARWCLTDHDIDRAVTALDAGRGLILYAATETRDIEARLVAKGDPALLQEWRQWTRGRRTPAEEPPSELRRKVVGALAGISMDPYGSLTTSPGEGTTRLLDPPDVHEVRAALVALGADALIYLVPGDERNGAAVVIPADAPPTWMQLPKLNDSGAAALDAFMREAAQGMTARSAQDREAATRDAGIKAPGVLSGISEWAWEAAIGPLLETHLAPPAGRPMRLVLIPVRELARVPWHAARRHVDGKRRYAMEQAVFSYAASARMFCGSAWRTAVPLTDRGLIVGDPDPGGRARDLPAARIEALAIRDHFYRDARYLGRGLDGQPSPEGPGTREEVLRWFADPDGGSVVHLACHGVVEERTSAGDSAYLVLDGGETLAAETLIRELGADPGREIALAVLAACSSGRCGRGYDEAFSLSTTLLAGRVRSVVGATWSVPDTATSVLMFLFHHFLRERGMPAADALREAQLCVIGHRELPDVMPKRLRDDLRLGDGSDIVSWAAFVHFGR